MRDIYLIDFENVASEGLSGITYLSEEDQVIIFYSNNSNRLTMKMHILIGKSICNLSYFEVTVGGKNALDHQISTYLGYLMGTSAAERNYYIVSRDMGYKHVANFWAGQKIGPRVRCIDSIKGASRLERNRREPVAQPVPQEPLTEAPIPENQVSVLPEELTPLSPVEPVVGEDVAPVEAPETPAVEAAPVETLVPEVLSPDSAPEMPVVPAETTEPEAEILISQPQDTPEAQPEAADEADAPVSTEPKPEPQRRLNRNRPRPRGRYRKNSGTVPEAKASAPVSQPVPPVEAQAEPLEKTVVEPQETAAPAEKKTEPKKRPGPKKSGSPRQEPANLDQLSSLIAPYPKLQESVLRDLIANNKRQVLCNTLRKHLGQEKGLALYNEIKKSAWH